MKLVFITDNNLKNDPYTTSKIIAEYGGQEHRAVRQLIRTHEKSLREFGKVSTFEMQKPENELGGRPEKYYKLNEEQATFLITLMKNTPQVVLFKKELVKQFFTMRQELEKRRLERETELKSRKELTEKIKFHLGNDNFKFIAFTQMIYKVLFGKDAQGLRDTFGINDKKKTPKDFMSSQDVEKIRKAEDKALTMLELGYDYQQVREQLDKIFNEKNIA
ncbi:MAG TPA: Rha family transcriptional regulator [Thermoanaerobacterales bacterium]|nr:Rha family transcriptional regulator [Thermoanaerobacterales bacterium]